MRTGKRGAAATLGVVVGMVLLAGLVAAVVGHPTSPTGPVYTVAQVQAALQQHPMAWAGRTVRVRGMAGGAAFGSTYMVYMCGPTPSTCTVGVPARTVVHLLLVPDGADAGGTTAGAGISSGNQTLTYHSSTAPDPVPGVVVLVQPPAPNALLTALRRVPLVGLLVPNGGQGTFHRSGVYWVRIPAKRTCDSATPLCDDAVLLAAPQ